MKNRGQVTAFVILGLVILVIVIVLVYTFSSALKKEEPLKEAVIEEEVSDVREYVTSCLEDSLKNAVEYCSGNFGGGGPKCPDYEQDITDRVRESFCDCIPQCTDFSALEHIQIEIKGEFSIETRLSNDKKKLTTTMEYPLLVKKGGSEHLLGTTESPFIAQYSLEESDCVPVDVDNHESCKATEETTVEILGIIFTYHVGDKVIVGGQCVAC